MTDRHAATELKLFIDSDYDLYRQQGAPIIKNLATKKARGVYKHALAVKLFGHLTEAGAKKYAKEFGSSDLPWHKMFDVATRKLAAEELTATFEAEHALGNYDNFLPKKYQGKASSSRHASKKSASSSKTSKWKVPGSIKIVWSVPNSAYLALWPGHGAIKDQQVLKLAGAEDMHEWLRSTYGAAYGIVGRTSSSPQNHHATISLGVHAHARRKSPAQLDREITHALASRRGGR